MSKELDLFDLIKQEEAAKREYKELLASGIFFEWFPELTGDYDRDELEWGKIYLELEGLRKAYGIKR